MNRRQNIADAALKLFADRGYENTPTQLIAKEAGVSEALIFKHFGNKEQLLRYIIKTGYMRVVEHNRGMLRENDPLQFIHRIIDLPYTLVAQEPYFWKLQYRLVDMPVSVNQHQRFLHPVNGLLVKAFRELGYEEPEKETRLVMLLLDTLWKNEVTRGGGADGMSEFIKSKYTYQTESVMR